MKPFNMTRFLAPNLGVAADRDPRERGSRPLNTDRYAPAYMMYAREGATFQEKVPKRRCHVHQLHQSWHTRLMLRRPVLALIFGELGERGT
jgi:hypothetical protein